MNMAIVYKRYSVRHHTVPYCTLQYRTVLHRTVRRSTVLQRYRNGTLPLQCCNPTSNTNVGLSQSYVDYISSTQGLYLNPCIQAPYDIYDAAKHSLPATFIPLEHTPWGCLTTNVTCWTMEGLEDVELVAARLSIRRAAPL